MRTGIDAVDKRSDSADVPRSWHEEDRRAGAKSLMRHALEQWVDEVARLTKPRSVHWCDGSQAEIDRLYAMMVADGSLVKLDESKHPDSYYARSDSNDVARVESRTFICSADPDDAGPTNNWVKPAEMHDRLEALFDGCMRDRTMYVIVYLMGPPGSPLARVGVEITDSPYVVANMRIMTRMGYRAFDALGSARSFVKGLHSVGRLDPRERYISHFPEENLVMSFGSNYGVNALLGKICFALRLAGVLARHEGWMAEHMLILGVTDPRGNKTYMAAAFPSACGKTNLAMLVPPEADRQAGWSLETIGDDIAWLRLGVDGRLYAINPENGFFGVAPGTSMKSNPNALLSCSANTIFTNVALCPDRTVWWEGLTKTPPQQCTDWRGRPWTPDMREPAAHPNSRFTAPINQCPCLSPEWDNPQGVPISAILFGGRRATTVPLVFQAYDWQHGTYVGAAMNSEKTAAADGKVGELRHDPMAMLPFCGYHMADYWQHWLDMGQRGGARMPAIFHINWFRKDAGGKWLWPGFGANIRVLAWIAARARGGGNAIESTIGYLPANGAINTEGLGVSESDLAELMHVDRTKWANEAVRCAAYLDQFGSRVPAAIRQQNQNLRKRLHVGDAVADSKSK